MTRWLSGVVVVALLGCRGDASWSMRWSEVREEKSKDSSTRTETYVLEGRELSLEVATRGARAKAPEKRQRTLSEGEVLVLERSIEARGLATLAEVDLGAAEVPGTNVELSLSVDADGKKTRVRVGGPAGEVGHGEGRGEANGDHRDTAHDPPESGRATIASDPLARQLRGFGLELKAMLR